VFNRWRRSLRSDAETVITLPRRHICCCSKFLAYAAGTHGSDPSGFSDLQFAARRNWFLPRSFSRQGLSVRMTPTTHLLAPIRPLPPRRLLSMNGTLLDQARLVQRFLLQR